MSSVIKKADGPWTRAELVTCSDIDHYATRSDKRDVE